jgi:chromate transporter
LSKQTTFSPPSLGRLAEVFFRIGNTTFGGGYVTIGMLGREIVETRRWLTSDKFDLAFALARITPGTNLIAFCAAIGALIGGIAGAVAAVLASTVPSAAVAVAFIYGFQEWQTNPVAMAAIGGTVAAVAGMMWSTIWTILRPHVGGRLRNIQVILIAGGAFLASWYFGVTPLPIILAGTLAGFFWRDPGK